MQTETAHCVYIPTLNVLSGYLERCVLVFICRYPGEDCLILANNKGSPPLCYLMHMQISHRPVKSSCGRIWVCLKRPKLGQISLSILIE